MVHTRSVQIGPEFFAKTFNDYADWQTALAREYLQNCLDAPGSRTVGISVEAEGTDTHLTVANDGAPMTEDILVNKLLALGGSGKNFNGTTGGFGRAKELLLFCHKSYTIQTGGFLVTGAGAGYDLTSTEPFAGTRSSILVAGDHVDSLREHFRRCIALSAWKGTCRLDGEVVADRLPRGRLRRDLYWAKVYTNGAHPNLLIVAINGLPMFTRRTSYRGCVVLELTGRSDELLQSSRDGLKWRQNQELDEFLRDLSVNRRKAMQEPKIEVMHYPGYKLQVSLPRTEQGPAAATAALAPVGGGPMSLVSVEGEPMLISPAPVPLGPRRAADADGRSPLSLEFIVKNDTGMALPNYYLPGEFAGYAQLLVRRWREILLELARLTKNSTPFCLGFFFSGELEAAHERSSTFGHVLYINPVRVRKNAGGARSFAKRWKFDATGSWELVAVAVHEWCHFEGYAQHDEEFAARQTELTGLVLKNAKRFGRLFDRGGATIERCSYET